MSAEELVASPKLSKEEKKARKEAKKLKKAEKAAKEAAAQEGVATEEVKEEVRKKDKKDKKEKKDKKRKSDVADTSIAPEPVAPEEGTASAEAVAMEVDGDRALKKQKKEKKEKRKSLAAEGAEEVEDKKAEFAVPADAISPIASPLAGKKLSKKLHKTVKKASKARQLKRGVKEVVKALRKGEKGLLLLASNITPIDVISHLPLLAEEAAGVEYCWVLSKEELGVYAGTKRATSCVLISTTPNKKATVSEEDRADVKATLEECMEEVKKLETAIKY